MSNRFLFALLNIYKPRIGISLRQEIFFGSDENLQTIDISLSPSVISSKRYLYACASTLLQCNCTEVLTNTL